MFPEQMAAERKEKAELDERERKAREAAAVTPKPDFIGPRNTFYLRFVWGLEPFWFQSVHLNDRFVPEIV
jgi:hypothetical protein